MIASRGDTKQGQFIDLIDFLSKTQYMSSIAELIALNRAILDFSEKSVTFTLLLQRTEKKNYPKHSLFHFKPWQLGNGVTFNI